MSQMNRPPPPRSAIRPDRIRRVDGGFSFIPNRFLHDGFLASLGLVERSLYLFLVVAADRNGVSFYRHDRICSTLEISLDDYLQARASLIDKDLVAFDGVCFQVLSLPSRPVLRPRPALITSEDYEDHDPATIQQIIRSSFDPRR
jgi:hypothetical protein